MSTLKNVVDDAATALSSQLSITVRFTNDYRVDLESMDAAVVAQAQTMFRIRSQHQTTAEGSNTTWQVGAVEIEISHRLSNAFDERTYTEGAMHTQQAALLAPSFWRDLSSVYQLTEPPSIEIDSKRVGNIVRWSVLCADFLIVPT